VKEESDVQLPKVFDEGLQVEDCLYMKTLPMTHMPICKLQNLLEGEVKKSSCTTSFRLCWRVSLSPSAMSLPASLNQCLDFPLGQLQRLSWAHFAFSGYGYGLRLVVSTSFCHNHV